MASIKVEKTSDYTVMSNQHLREKNMSLKAKGLLSVMLSLPDKWDYSVAGLVAICKENESAIKSTLEELKNLGYLEVIKRLPNETESGRIEYEYIVYEQKQEGEKQGVDFLGVEFLGVENHGQLNNNKLNTNILNTNNNKKIKKENFTKQIEDFTADNEERELLIEWLNVRKAKRGAMTEKAIELNLNRLRDYAEQSGMSVKEYLQEIICRGWQAFYVINNYANSKKENKRNIDFDNLFTNVIE